MDSNPLEETYQDLCRRVVQWAESQPTIQVVLLIGSRARLDHPGDAWSDLDLVIFANDLQLFTERAWLSKFGDVLLQFQDTTGRGDPEWIVVFADGIKADFAVVKIPEYSGNEASSLQVLLALTDGYHEIFQRGILCLLDRSNPARENKAISVRRSQLETPSQEQFSDCIQRLLIEALRAAKFIRRRDIWQASKSCNLLVQHHILTLAEWQARATRGPAVDTWYNGRFMEDWADPWFLVMLPGLSAGYDLQQLNQSLHNSLQCAERLASEIATGFNLEFPQSIFSQANRLIVDILARED